MNYELIDKPALNSSECLVVGICSNTESDVIKSLDKQYNGIGSKLISKLNEPGDNRWQSDIDGHALLIIHCGPIDKYTQDSVSRRIAEIAHLLFKNNISTATICMPQLKTQQPDWQLQQMILKLETIRYQFLDLKSQTKKPHLLKRVSFYLPHVDKKTIETAHSIAEGIRCTRDLANLPANICTPSYLAEQALHLAQSNEKISATIHTEEDMREMGMGALLAVSQGSSQAPKLIELHYKGEGDSAPVILVGKGITFDSGGLSLKPAEAMTEMKYDMCGAASVFGALKACALLNLPIHLICLIPCAENMTGGAAVKPGDIVTSMSGKTIEILNTDAEGRLVLADALTYAERFNPKFVIDIATLTGAMVVALGTVQSGFMTKDETLAADIISAAKDSDDKVWRMPLDEAYQHALDSPIADMVNATFDRTAGAITAACFLSRFTEKYPWAHLDIAGTSWVTGKSRNATGRPVPLLIELLRKVSNAR